MTLSHDAISDPLNDATAIAREAGALLLQYLHRTLRIDEKGHRADIVTDADRASERLIVERLRAAYPEASILGEESGMHEGTSRERWIVDPLDGTTNYAHKYPLFCVSIAYERDGELQAGVVYAPFMDECFAAARGRGAFLNGTRIGVSAVGRVADALTCTGFHPSNFAENSHNFESVSNVAQAVRRDGSAALDLAYVACGRFDAFWELDLQPWDVAAGTLLVLEAGGRVTKTGGSAARVERGSILATNGAVHDEMLRTLAI